MLDNNIDSDQNDIDIETIDQEANQEKPDSFNWRNLLLRILLSGLMFASGLGSGYILWGRSKSNQSIANETTIQPAASKAATLIDNINPQEGSKLKVNYGDVGPKLLAAGVINLKIFEQLYQQSGQPLTDQEIELLTKGDQNQVIFTRENAHFLLNYFWALGLANKNPILDNGPIQKYSRGQIASYASTGGWTIGTKPIFQLFSAFNILSLSAEQQARVEEVAKAVYRPCCDNPTDFPDCNHGMAMLGLLELMASQNATTDEMFAAAKTANAFWFPQQTLEQAIFFKATQNVDYVNIDPKMIVSNQYSSSSGFQYVHQWLDKNGLLEQAPGSGNNCGV